MSVDPNQIPGGIPEALAVADPTAGDVEEDDEEGGKKTGRRKINIEFIEDKSRRHITFSKRKAGIMKKAYELSALTGTQVLLLVASETGHVYTYATEKLQPLIQKPEGKNLIQTCLSAPDAAPASDSQARAVPYADSSQQYAAMAAAAAAAASQAAAAGERPAKQRKVGLGGPPVPVSYPGGIPAGGIPALAQAGARGFGAGGIPGLAGLAGASQLQGLNPALLQQLMTGQLAAAAAAGGGMMGDGAFNGAGGIKLEALQQTIADAAANAALNPALAALQQQQQQQQQPLPQQPGEGSGP